MVGTVVNNYKIIKEIDNGGMGTIYLAQHQTLQKNLAVKKLHPKLIKDAMVRKRFLQEAKTQAKLKHSGITEIIDYIEQDNSLYILLEYLEGETLYDYIFRKKGLLPEAEANRFMTQILEAVSYAHKRNVIHRDLKPSNIFVLNNGNIKILDFGISKILGDDSNQTKSGSLMGSPSYMSPEQVSGKNVDQRSDIYALGVIYFEMLTGQHLYNNKELAPIEIYNRIINEPLPRIQNIYAHTSNVAQNIIDTATRKDSANRFQTCDDFLIALRNGVVPKEEVTIPNGARQNNVRAKSSNRNSLPIFILIGIAIALIPLLIIHFNNNTKAKGFVKEANQLLLEGFYDESIAVFQKAQDVKNSASVDLKIKGLNFLVEALKKYYVADFAEAFELFSQSAKFKTKEAYFYLGELTLNGYGTNKDIEKGLFYTQKSYDLGYDLAAWRLANQYGEGVGVERNQAIADSLYYISWKYLKILERKGDPVALGILGHLYLKGAHVSKDEEKAFEYFLRAAQANNAEIQPILADCYFNKVGTSIDEKQGFYWLENSAKLGHPLALLQLGNRHYSGKGVTKDKVEGVARIRQAASHNYADALIRLRDMSKNAEFSKGNFSSSFDLTQAAVKYDFDNAIANENLAHDYEHGFGTDKDYKEAVEYYKIAYSIDPSKSDLLVKIAELYSKGGYNLEPDEAKSQKITLLYEQLENKNNKATLGCHYPRKVIEANDANNYALVHQFLTLASKPNNKGAKDNLAKTEFIIQKTKQKIWKI